MIKFPEKRVSLLFEYLRDKRFLYLEKPVYLYLHIISCLAVIAQVFLVGDRGRFSFRVF